MVQLFTSKKEKEIMKLSELIKKLEKEKEEKGDINVYGLYDSFVVPVYLYHAQGQEDWNTNLWDKCFGIVMSEQALEYGYD